MAEHIKNLFSYLIPQYAEWKINLIKNWDSILGDLHEQVTLINIHQHMLTLGVYDAAWLQELYILSPVLIKTINSHLGNEYIKNLRFKNIGYKKKEKNEPKLKKRYEKRIVATPITHDENLVLKTVEDSDLRDALERYLIRCKEIE